LYRADTSFENLAARRRRLVPFFGKKISLSQPIHFCEPLTRVSDQGLQEHAFIQAANANLLALKAKLARQTDGLASPIAE
jgi:hypothetical protein